MPKNSTPKVQYVEYTLRIPTVIDDFINDLCFKENQKISDPSQFLNADAMYIMIIRDFYVSGVAPQIQKEAIQKFAKELEKIFAEVYK